MTSSRVRRFRVSRNTSIVKTRLNRSAENVTPHRIGGRVTATKSGSAVRPAFLPLMGHLHAEHPAHPGDDLWGPEGDRDPEDSPNGPAPRNPVRHRHASQHHDQDDGNGRKPSENV